MDEPRHRRDDFRLWHGLYKNERLVERSMSESPGNIRPEACAMIGCMLGICTPRLKIGLTIDRQHGMIYSTPSTLNDDQSARTLTSSVVLNVHHM
jgi:hypothetical protein